MNSKLGLQSLPPNYAGSPGSDLKDTNICIARPFNWLWVPASKLFAGWIRPRLGEQVTFEHWKVLLSEDGQLQCASTLSPLMPLPFIPNPKAGGRNSVWGGGGRESWLLAAEGAVSVSGRVKSLAQRELNGFLLLAGVTEKRRQTSLCSMHNVPVSQNN